MLWLCCCYAVAMRLLCGCGNWFAMLLLCCYNAVAMLLLINCLEKGPSTKSDEFSEKGKRGGSFSIQNLMLQILGNLNRAF